MPYTNLLNILVKLLTKHIKVKIFIGLVKISLYSIHFLDYQLNILEEKSCMFLFRDKSLQQSLYILLI